MKLLIIDDEWLIADSIERTLLAAGHIVAGSCGSLEQALELVKCAEYDLVVLDANLRGASSVPIAVELQMRGIPFIITSGYGSGQRAPELAAAPFLRKPFGPADLLEKLAVAKSGQKVA